VVRYQHTTVFYYSQLIWDIFGIKAPYPIDALMSLAGVFSGSGKV